MFTSFIIGVTIVALGTSLPELASSIEAVLMGDSKIVIGNVAGSNIANIALVLGLVAVVGKQVKVNEAIMNVDIPILVSSAFLLWFVVYDQTVTVFEAIVLLGALVIFLVYSLNNNEGEETEKTKIEGKDIGILILAGIAIKFSAEYTIKSIIDLSKLLNIGSEVIAASVVALGTSLPEVFSRRIGMSSRVRAWSLGWNEVQQEVYSVKLWKLWLVLRLGNKAVVLESTQTTTAGPVR